MYRSRHNRIKNEAAKQPAGTLARGELQSQDMPTLTPEAFGPEVVEARREKSKKVLTLEASTRRTDDDVIKESRNAHWPASLNGRQLVAARLGGCECVTQLVREHNRSGGVNLAQLLRLPKRRAVLLRSRDTSKHFRGRTTSPQMV